MPAPHSTSAGSDLLRLSDEQFAHLEALTRKPAAPDRGPDNRPDEPRDRSARAVRLVGSHLGSVIASLSPAQGLDVVAFRVRVLDLSRTGLAFVHGASVFPGTACEIAACGASGTEHLMAARVVRCRLIEGRAHEVGVRFDTPICLDELLGTARARRDAI